MCLNTHRFHYLLSILTAFQKVFQIQKSSYAAAFETLGLPQDFTSHSCTILQYLENRAGYVRFCYLLQCLHVWTHVYKETHKSKSVCHN